MDDPLIEEKIIRDDISIQSEGSDSEEILNNINSQNINYEEDKNSGLNQIIIDISAILRYVLFVEMEILLLNNMQIQIF